MSRRTRTVNREHRRAPIESDSRVAADHVQAPDHRGCRALPRRRALVVTLLAFDLAIAGCGVASPDESSVTLEVARTELEAGRAVLIDVREPNEHAAGVAAGARLLPMRQLASRLGEIPTDPKVPVLLICNSQNRSSATLKALREREGYRHVRYVQGGMSEWVRRGWPTVKPGP